MAHVTFVSGEEGDWIGMYVDGCLAEEGHSIYAAHVARSLIGIQVETVESFEVGQEWLEEQMSLPANLGDIPPEVRK